jgi:hypothetical protein
MKIGNSDLIFIQLSATEYIVIYSDCGRKEDYINDLELKRIVACYVENFIDLFLKKFGEDPININDHGLYIRPISTLNDAKGQILTESDPTIFEDYIPNCNEMYDIKTELPK